MAAQSSPAQSTASILDSAILLALTLAKVAATGIGIRGNTKRGAGAGDNAFALVEIESVASPHGLRVKLGEIVVEYKSLAEKSRVKQFFKGNDYKQRIQDIKNSIASQIHQFTVCKAPSFQFLAERKEIKHLPTTLPFQLADYSALFRTWLIELLDNDRTGLLDAEPRLHFQKMIVEILEKMLPSSKP
ncbi:hypothetical protein DFH09DRAFT_1325314 [Mycena vulgaris]|nr:hypothetical protein DFH09DRAFT_1325314 [Mycena vulgaris]